VEAFPPLPPVAEQILELYNPTDEGKPVFPLPVLTLKERLYLREQDTGKGLYLVIGNPHAVVIAGF